MDREKVISGLKYCTHTDGTECPNCPYWNNDDCVEMLNVDVLSLLNKQDELLHKKQNDIDRLCNEISEWKHKFHDTLKEKEEKPLRCDKCSYHREDGWCGMNGQWVNETDYCSLGAWESW